MLRVLPHSPKSYKKNIIKVHLSYLGRDRNCNVWEGATKIKEILSQHILSWYSYRNTRNLHKASGSVIIIKF